MPFQRFIGRLATPATIAIACFAAFEACKAGGATPAPAPPPQQRPAAAVAPAQPTATKPAASTFRVPPEPTFDLPDDAPIDPAEEARALRHNCCDEAAASEVEAARSGNAETVSAHPRKHKRAP